MYDIMVFQNERFGKVRTLDENGKVLFNGKDVATALGYSDKDKAIRDNCPHPLKRRVGVRTGTKANGEPAMQQVNMVFIPEGDVYRLITHSRLPEAERFERWVFDEVLPTIRRQGAYAPDLTAIITQAVQAAVTQTIQALMPYIMEAQAAPVKPKRIRRRITSLINQLETPLKAEMEDMILDSNIGFVAISDYFRDRYGILISKSSIGRYAQRMYEQIEAAEDAAENKNAG